ncbi:hypothetical protein C0991_008666, partial [Blastosporella zonata]
MKAAFRITPRTSRKRSTNSSLLISEIHSASMIFRDITAAPDVSINEEELQEDHDESDTNVSHEVEAMDDSLDIERESEGMDTGTPLANASHSE